MSEAIQLCGEAQKKEEVPIACVIVKDHVVIGKGFNQTLSQQNPLAHAEMIAIEAASKNIHNWRLSSCDLFVTVEPCLMCLGAIILARIRAVYYGISNAEYGAWSSQKINQNLTLKTLIFHGILENQIEQIMKNFFVQLRRGG
ncbi:MAG TPA: nucleoside deaminase [Caldisericia bacterium]|nr:nucleoside deaminase [Caldisericia bacterium]